ncbi:MAG: Hemin transport system permease protein HmuU [Spirochaetes bacterium ADurb.Bin269]|nr:MAG: Hemin transport system permease protein HmuU [Spirochaetes bacterium ADurb.Bin269]HPX46975.1 iron ABC transporter permease [Treponemataceae bacterium]
MSHPDAQAQAQAQTQTQDQTQPQSPQHSVQPPVAAITFWMPALILSFLTIGLATGAGSVFIAPADCVSILLHKTLGTELADGIKVSAVGIVWNLRFPRVLFAFLAGGALSVSGAVMQSILKNPLASSFTLGISSGATLGAALVILGSAYIPVAASLTVPAAGFIFSALTFFAVMALSRAVDPELDNGTIILTGMVVSLFISAALTLLSAFSGQEMNRLLLWQMGSFALKGWPPVYVLLPVAIGGTALVSAFAGEMDILTFGDEDAQALGVNVKRTKRILIALSSLLTGCAVAWAGVIGFLDLAVPHAVRRVVGPGHRALIPLSFFTGGIVMTLADLAARTLIPPLDLPVGAITAVLGAPVLGWIYYRSGRGRR